MGNDSSEAAPTPEAVPPGVQFLTRLPVRSFPRSLLAGRTLDRLGRSTRELLDLIEGISKAGASFRSLGDPLRDTSSSQGRLLSTLLAAIAEFERDLIRERTGDGRKQAMAKGVKFGRKPKLSEYQRKEALKRRAAGETLAEIAKSYAVDISMISRLKAQRTAYLGGPFRVPKTGGAVD